MAWRFCVTPRIVFGPASVENTGSEARDLGAKSVLIVTDVGVLGAGLIEPVVESLTTVGVKSTIFSDVRPKPLVSDVDSAVKKAEANAIVAHIKNISDASKSNWTASAWFLERKYPELFGKREVEPKVENKILIQLATIGKELADSDTSVTDVTPLLKLPQNAGAPARE